MHFSRRHFLAGLAGAAITASLRRAAQAAPALPVFGGGPARLGTVTYNLARDWDVSRIISHCTETGFEAVELRTTHGHGVEPTLSAGDRAMVRKMFADSKVRLLSLGTACEFHAPDAAAVRRHIDECKRFITLAHDIGALGVKVRPNGIPKDVPEEKTIAQIGAALRECGEFAQTAEVEVWVEVHGKDSAHPPRIAEMMKACGHESVGVCWNSNQDDLMGGTSVKPAFDLLKPWLRNVHINELWNEKYPWRELFTLLREAGYSRYMLAEIPATTDPLRLMRYYRALWRELSSA
jgi:sugar phosphate isomerase/epimerase